MKNLGKPPLKKKNKDNFEDFHDIRWIYMSGKSGNLTEEYVREIDHARV